MKITDELLTKAWALFKKGDSLSSIAKHLKVSRSGLTDRLKEEYGYDAFEAVKQGLYRDPKPEETKAQKTKKTKPQKTEITEIKEIKTLEPIPKPNNVTESESIDEVTFTAEDVENLDYIVTSKSITLMYRNNTRKYDQTDEFYTAVKNACLQEDYAFLLRLIKPVDYINENIPEFTVDVTKLVVTVNGVEFPYQYSNLIISEMDKDIHNKQNPDLQNLVNFFARCVQHNISTDVVIQMYEFLKHNDIVILPDGSIQGWKYLHKRDDIYLDEYTKTIVNTEGSYVSMPREEVDNNPNQTCSKGLHIGAWDYVKTHSNITKVIVNPEDVVSVPVDYEGMKLRCCKYYIHEILDNPNSPKDFVKPIKL